MGGVGFVWRRQLHTRRRSVTTITRMRSSVAATLALQFILLGCLLHGTASDFVFDFGAPILGPSSCILGPRRPPQVPPAIPPMVDACDLIECPAPPTECFAESVCQRGQCLDPVPKSTGATCSDSDPTTVGDACMRGRCVTVGT